MITAAENTSDIQAAVAGGALAMAQLRAQTGKGRSQAHCVRLTGAVQSLLEHAKPDKQSMVAFLREAAVTVALQRLDASQN